MNFVAAGPSGSLAIVESFHSLANTLYAKSVEVKANTISESVSQISDAAPAIYRMVWVASNDVLLVLEMPWSRTPYSSAK